MTSRFPCQMKRLDAELNEELTKFFPRERTGFLQVGAAGWLLPSKYEGLADCYYNFQVRPDDTWVVSFPRSGTTVTQEMVWMIANGMDYETAGTIPLTTRFPFLDSALVYHDDVLAELRHLCSDDPSKLKTLDETTRSGLEVLEAALSPRFIKTHLPFSLLPPGLLSSGCKVVYVARSPKDVAVSFYHHNRLFRPTELNQDFRKYWSYFQEGLGELESECLRKYGTRAKKSR